MSLNLDYLFKFLIRKSCISLKLKGLSLYVNSVATVRCIDDCACSILLEGKQMFSMGEFDNIYLYMQFSPFFLSHFVVYNFISVYFILFQ